MPSRRYSALLVLLFAGLLALHAWRYLPYFCDEALVSLRYAKRWADGRGLTWTDGERALGTANFLWVVLLGIAAKFGAGLIASARVLGFAGVVLVIYCAGLEPRGRGLSLPRLVVGGTLVVTTAPFAIWSIAGLEAGLLAGLVALSLRLLERSVDVLERRQLLLSGAPLAAIALLRADGLVLVVALLAGAACLPRPGLVAARRAALLAAPSVVGAAMELGLRRAYYGEWLPSVSPPKLAGEGLAYVGRGYASSSMLVLLALAATVLSLRRGDRWRLVMPWAVIAVWSSTVAAAGGDALPGFRELVPALAPLCFVVADEVAADWSRIVGQRLLILPVLALCVVLHATQGTETAENRLATESRSEWEGLAVGQTLKAAFGSKRPLLAAEKTGALAFSTEFASLDPGFGDRAKVLGRAPDLVAFLTSAGAAKPESTAGLALVKSREFRASYQRIRVEADGAAAVGMLWVRRERGRLGVVRKPDHIELPGYFFGGNGSSAISRLDSRGELVAMLSWDSPGALSDLPVPAGRFRIDLVPADPTLVVDVLCGDASMQRLAPVVGRVFESDGSMAVSIVVAPRFGSAPIPLRAARLTPVSDVAPTLRCVPEGTPLRISGAWLASPGPRRVPASHPSNVAISAAGLLVDLGEKANPKHLELSLSRNTSFTLELRQGGHAVWPATIGRSRRSQSATLGHHRFDLPKLPEGSGPFELLIKPAHGTSASVGSVELE